MNGSYSIISCFIDWMIFSSYWIVILLLKVKSVLKLGV